MVISCCSRARNAWRPLRSLIAFRSPEIEHAVGQRLLVGQRVEHAVLDGVLGDQVDHGDGRVWCLRQARAMRCSSLAGFQGRSQLMTTLAVCRLSPVRAGVGAEEDAAVRDRS